MSDVRQRLSEAAKRLFDRYAIDGSRRPW